MAIFSRLAFLFPLHVEGPSSFLKYSFSTSDNTGPQICPEKRQSFKELASKRTAQTILRIPFFQSLVQQPNAREWQLMAEMFTYESFEAGNRVFNGKPQVAVMNGLTVPHLSPCLQRVKKETNSTSSLWGHAPCLELSIKMGSQWR